CRVLRIESAGQKEGRAVDRPEARAEEFLRALSQAAEGPRQTRGVVAEPPGALLAVCLLGQATLRPEDRERLPRVTEPGDAARRDLRGEGFVADPSLGSRGFLCDSRGC